MGTLIETVAWEAGVPYFEADAILTGGPNCPDNIPIQALANRTAFLKKQIDDAVSGALTVMYANRLKTARTITMSGDGTWSVSFDGNGNVTAAMTLANSGVAAGTYRSVTVDGKGRVIAATNPTTLAGYGITDALLASSYTAADVLTKLKTVDGAASGLDADLLDGQQGSYYLAWGSLTGKPTTLAGYGITDASVANLTDTTITAPAAGHLLRWNGTKWVNVALVAADIPALDWSKITSGLPATLAGYGITIATQGEAEAGTDNSKPMTPLRVKQAIDINSVLSRSYVSPQQTITTGGLLTLAHGLGVVPKIISSELVFLTAEAGYSVGDIVEWVFSDEASGNTRGVSIVKDATNITVRYSNLANTFAAMNKSTGASAVLTNANLAFVVRAYA